MFTMSMAVAPGVLLQYVLATCLTQIPAVGVYTNIIQYAYVIVDCHHV